MAKKLTAKERQRRISEGLRLAWDRRKMPRRVVRKRTKGWRMPANTVYVGRPTKWGNPFVGPGAVLAYRRWLKSGWRTWLGSIDCLDVEHIEGWETLPRDELVKCLHELRGKNLACWCPKGQPCHADVLLELANKPEGK